MRRNRSTKLGYLYFLVIVGFSFLLSYVSFSSVKATTKESIQRLINGKHVSFDDIIDLSTSVKEPTKPTLNDIFKWLDNFPEAPLFEGGNNQIFLFFFVIFLTKNLGIGNSLLSNNDATCSIEKYEIFQYNMQGHSLLHSYCPFEALRAFYRAYKLGGTCCSIYWGMS